MLGTVSNVTESAMVGLWGTTFNSPLAVPVYYVNINSAATAVSDADPVITYYCGAAPINLPLVLFKKPAANSTIIGKAYYAPTASINVGAQWYSLNNVVGGSYHQARFLSASSSTTY